MNVIKEKWECRVADALFEGECTASDISRKAHLSIGTVRNILGSLINKGEVENRVAPDRSGEMGRIQTLYSLVRTQRKRA